MPVKVEFWHGNYPVADKLTYQTAEPDIFVGCGVCTTKCAFDAITLHRTHPECTHMFSSEDKFKEIGAYAITRAAKIAFSKKTPEEKASQKAHKEYKKANK